MLLDYMESVEGIMDTFKMEMNTVVDKDLIHL